MERPPGCAGWSSSSWRRTPPSWPPRRGQVDVAYTSATYSDQAIDGYTLAAYPTVDNRGLNLPAVPPAPTPPARQVGNDFTADMRVRRAINIGVDRQEMIDHVLNGYGSPAYSVCDGLPWYNPASQVEYDPEGAAAPSGGGGLAAGGGRLPLQGRDPGPAGPALHHRGLGAAGPVRRLRQPDGGAGHRLHPGGGGLGHRL